MRAAALAILLLSATSAAAAIDLENNLFISPSGEPFVAPNTDPYPIVAWFDKADANHDGQIDLAEFKADAERFFLVLDRNKDGYIDSGEINIYEHNMVPEILAPHSADAGGLLVRVVLQDTDHPRQTLNTRQGAVEFGLFAEPEPVLSADRNLDGLVSRKEFQDQAERHFLVLDVKKRGYFTLADLPKTEAERTAKAKRVMTTAPSRK
jgi:hypothetical protein